MAGYRELLARVKEEIDEISTLDAHERHQSPDTPLFVDVREPDEWEEGHIPGAIYTGRGRLEQRIEGLVPDKTRPLVVYCSAGSRSAFAAKALEDLGYENVVEPRGRVQRLEAKRLRDHDPARPLRRAARALQPAPPHPGGRRGRPAAPARLARPSDRRRRARLARVALPRRRRRRHARHRRRGRRRRVEPPAPDRPLDGPARRAEGALGEAHARGAEPGRATSCRSRSG